MDSDTLCSAADLSISSLDETCRSSYKLLLRIAGLQVKGVEPLALFAVDGECLVSTLHLLF